MAPGKKENSCTHNGKPRRKTQTRTENSDDVSHELNSFDVYKVTLMI